MKPYYDHDGITIYRGDCREVVPELVCLPCGGRGERKSWINGIGMVEGRCPDCEGGRSAPGVIVTDPPYGIGWSRGENKARLSKAHTGIQGDESTATRDAVLALLPDLPGIVFGSFYAPFPGSLKQVLVWRKPPDAGLVGSVTGYRRDAEPVFLVGPWPQRSVEWSSVLDPGAGGMASTAAQTGHPHTKPVDLLRRLIERSPDGLILDPFMGSGTTLRAAKDLGRKAIGIEIEEKYCEIAAQRLGQEVLDLGSAA